MAIYTTVAMTLFVELIVYSICVFFKSQKEKRQEIFCKITDAQSAIYTLQRDRDFDKRKIMDMDGDLSVLRKTVADNASRLQRLEMAIDDMQKPTTATATPSPKRRHH